MTAQRPAAPASIIPNNDNAAHVEHAHVLIFETDDGGFVAGLDADAPWRPTRAEAKACAARRVATSRARAPP